ncbi:MAG: hypothetical protein P8L44_14115 [Opitutales bacterium]|nr:hypothetical protein [Opitutales bacterium]
MFFTSSPQLPRLKKQACGWLLTFFIAFGSLSSALSGQTLLEQIYNPENDQFSIRLSLPVSLQDSIVKGD